MRPTRCTLTLAAASCALMGMALLLDSPAFLLAGASLAVIPLAAAVAFQQKTKEILVSVSVVRTPGTRVARQGTELSIEVTATCTLPADTRVRIRELLPADMIRTKSMPEISFPSPDAPRIVYPVIPLMHGTLVFPGIHIGITDRFFRTAADMTATAYAGPEIMVLPVPCFEVSGSNPSSSGRLEKDRFSIHKGATIRAFRDYIPGDDLRFIDWKLSAKYEKFIVRQYTAQEKMPGLIVLDLPDRFAGYDTEAFARLINRVTGDAERSLRTAGEVSILLISGINLADMLLNERRLSRCITWLQEEAYPRNRLYHAYRLETGSEIRTTRRSIQRQIERTSESPDLQAFLRRYEAVLSQDLTHREKYVFDVQLSRLLEQAGPFDEIRIYSLLTGDTSHIRHAIAAAQNAHIESRILSPAFCDRTARLRFTRKSGTVSIEAIS